MKQYSNLIEKYKKELAEKQSAEREYSCAMAYLDQKGKIAKSIIDFAKSIPENELYVAEEGHGVELEPHTTILYGLHSNDPKEIFGALELNENINATLGKLTFFENDKFNVLKIDIKSETLKKLNKKLTDNMEYTNDYPDYHPHMTIAYLNKDVDKTKYMNNDMFEGVDLAFQLVKVSGPKSEKVFNITENK